MSCGAGCTGVKINPLIRLQPAGFFQIFAAALDHTFFKAGPIDVHQDLICAKLGLAEEDIEGIPALRGSVDAYSRNFSLLDVLGLGIDQQGFDIMLVLPGNAGAGHSQVRIHDGA